MSELSEDEKLVRLGIRSANVTPSAGAEVISVFKSNLSEDYDKFAEDLEDEGLSDYSGLQSYLETNGVEQGTASSVTDNLQNTIGSFSDFSKAVENSGSYPELESNFSTVAGIRGSRKNEAGAPASGVRVYNQQGVGRSGQKIPAGGVEVFGSEIHFSETGTIRKTEAEVSGEKQPFELSNLSVSKNPVEVTETTEVSAEVTSNLDYPEEITLGLVVDSEVQETDTIRLLSLQIKDVLFETEFDELGEREVTIGTLPPEDVRVVPKNL